MFIALDKLTNQGLKQAIVVVPEKSIGSSFNDEALTTRMDSGQTGPSTLKWNLCNAPGEDGGRGSSECGPSSTVTIACLFVLTPRFRFSVERFWNRSVR
jgi:hypothetical protein